MEMTPDIQRVSDMQTKIPQLAPGLEIGLVRWFDNRPGKQFGFLSREIENSKEGEIFFHRNDRKLASSNGDGAPHDFPVFKDLVQISPVLGKPPAEWEVLVFKTSPGSKGPKASPWTTWSEYEKAYRTIHPSPLYRVVGRYPHPRREGHGQATFSAGISMEVFFLRHPDCREDLTKIGEYYKLPNYIDEAWIEMLPVGKNEYTESDWERVDKALSVPNENDPKLKITARYGTGGHEWEYVIQLWTLKGVYSGQEHYEHTDFPYEFSKALEEVIDSHPFCFSICDRGSRIEVTYFPITREERRTTRRNVTFGRNHPECERLIKQALQKVEERLKEIRGIKNDSERKIAQCNISDLIQKRKLIFNVETIEVG